MSLADFQRAFALMVADPVTWAGKLNDCPREDELLELSARERERLRVLLAHPRMSANRLHVRANRMMPIVASLPLTCSWLRTEMSSVLDAWLAGSPEASIQYAREAKRFAGWLPAFLRSGLFPHPALDALRYEMCIAEFVSRAADAPLSDIRIRTTFDFDLEMVLQGWSPSATPLVTPEDMQLRAVDGVLVLERVEALLVPAS